MQMCFILSLRVTGISSIVVRGLGTYLSVHKRPPFFLEKACLIYGGRFKVTDNICLALGIQTIEKSELFPNKGNKIAQCENKKFLFIYNKNYRTCIIIRK